MVIGPSGRECHLDAGFLPRACEDAEMQLRQAVHRLHMWQGTKVLLCIDGGMDEETRRVCELFTQDFPVCRVVTPEEVADMCRCAESNCNPVENRVY